MTLEERCCSSSFAPCFLSDLESVAAWLRWSYYLGMESYTLLSPPSCRIEFHIRLEVTEDEGVKTTHFTIEEVGSSNGGRSYSIIGLKQGAWLEFSHSLARDFALSYAPPTEPIGEGINSSLPLLPFAIDHRILYGYGDPAVLFVEGRGYFLVATSNDAEDAFPILYSEDLTSWELRGFVFPKGECPSWAAEGELIGDFWAPELHQANGEFRVYFVARHKGSLELCIGVATSSSPEGPFRAASEPLLRGEKIDPHLYLEEDGTSYLLWKEDGNGVWPALLNELLYDRPELIDQVFLTEGDRRAISVLVTLWPYTRTLPPMERFFIQNLLIEVVRHDFPSLERRLRALLDVVPEVEVRKEIEVILSTMKTSFFVQELSPDGLSLRGEPKKILENDQSWEAHVIEGMWVVKRLDKYFLFYAANDFSTADYGIGIAVSDSLLGPYKKMQEPFLRTSKEWLGPGHPSITRSKGKDLLIYHAYRPHAIGYKEFRAVLALELDYETLLKRLSEK